MTDLLQRAKNLQAAAREVREEVEQIVREAGARDIHFWFTVQCPSCTELFEVNHLEHEVLTTGTFLGQCDGCGLPVSMRLYTHSLDELERLKRRRKGGQT